MGQDQRAPSKIIASYSKLMTDDEQKELDHLRNHNEHLHARYKSAEGRADEWKNQFNITDAERDTWKRRALAAEASLGEAHAKLDAFFNK